MVNFRMGLYRSLNTMLRLLLLLSLLYCTGACQGSEEPERDTPENTSPCAGQEDGTIVSLGDPSGCEYPSACAEKGSSTVINEICVDEIVTQQIETQDCSRNTEGKLIATGEPGSHVNLKQPVPRLGTLFLCRFFVEAA